MEGREGSTSVLSGSAIGSIPLIEMLVRRRKIPRACTLVPPLSRKLCALFRTSYLLTEDRMLCSNFLADIWLSARYVAKDLAL